MGSFRSLSARRAWIEIAYSALEGASEIVALRKESVDRNKHLGLPGWLRVVALRKESVDRNCMGVTVLGINHKSLSARRAWIEIGIVIKSNNFRAMSLSARRAWIEIKILQLFFPAFIVALRKESVDRNKWFLRVQLPAGRRSPQGERG